MGNERFLINQIFKKYFPRTESLFAWIRIRNRVRYGSRSGTNFFFQILDPDLYQIVP